MTEQTNNTQRQLTGKRVGVVVSDKRDTPTISYTIVPGNTDGQG